MQKIFLIVAILLILIPGASGVEITSINDIPNVMIAQVGSQLFIPCSFDLDTITPVWNIQMEWGMVPLEGGPFKSYVYSYFPERLVNHNSRAHVFHSLINQGNCSLVIDPVSKEDNGFLELHLSIDGNNYEPFPSVYVTVLEDLYPERRSLNLNGNLMNIPKYTLILCIFAAFLVLALTASIGAIICYELRRRKRKRDKIILEEEGSLHSSDSDTSIDYKDTYQTKSELLNLTRADKESAPDVRVVIPPEKTSEGQSLNLHVQVTYTCTCNPRRVAPSTSSFNLCVPPEAASLPSAVTVVMPAGLHICTCVPAKMCTIRLLSPVASSLQNAWNMSWLDMEKGFTLVKDLLGSES